MHALRKVCICHHFLLFPRYSRVRSFVSRLLQNPRPRLAHALCAPLNRARTHTHTQTAFKCAWNGTPVVKVRFHLLNQADAEAERNFRDELAVVARLAHPNIVQFLGRCRGELAFVVAHCAHGSLFDVLFSKVLSYPAQRGRLFVLCDAAARV